MSEALWWIRCAFLHDLLQCNHNHASNCPIWLLHAALILLKPVCRQHVCHDAKIPPAMHDVQGAQHASTPFFSLAMMILLTVQEDSSLTRSDAYFLDLIERAGYVVTGSALQRNFPKGLFKVKPGGASIMLMAIATCLQSSASAHMRI